MQRDQDFTTGLTVVHPTLSQRFPSILLSYYYSISFPSILLQLMDGLSYVNSFPRQLPFLFPWDIPLLPLLNLRCTRFLRKISSEPVQASVHVMKAVLMHAAQGGIQTLSQVRKTVQRNATATRTPAQELLIILRLLRGGSVYQGYLLFHG